MSASSASPSSFNPADPRPVRRAGGSPSPSPRRRSALERVEAYLSRLSTKNNFFHRLFSMIWLPFAFRSGIKMKRLDQKTFTAVLPFRRFNRNWYNAMAGAALLGNSEIAGGMYVFGICGGDYTVVCKHLEYKFLRPCLGPAVYKITPREDIHALLATRGEFNITIDLDIMQAITKIPGSRPKGGAGSEGGGAGGAGASVGAREKRVGRCTATFHVTPKVHHKTKRERRMGGGGQGGAGALPAPESVGAPVEIIERPAPAADEPPPT